MKTTLVILGVFTTLACGSSFFVPITKMPRAEPTTTQKDSWQCVTENITQYVDVPKATGALQAALLSYNDKMLENCTLSLDPTATTAPKCPFPPKSIWCGFSSAAPTSVLPAYSEYASAASSWWAARSAKVASLPTDCPVTWKKVMDETPGGGEAWLNGTILDAECYADAHPASISSTLMSAPTRSGATTGAISTIPSGVTGTSNPTSTKVPNSVVGRMEGFEMWAVAATLLTVAAVNTAW